MGGKGTEGKDLLLWGDKRKRKRGCGSVGLYLDKRKTRKRKKWRKNQFLTQSRVARLSSDWGLQLYTCAWRGRGSPGLGSQLRGTDGESRTIP